MSGGTLVRSLSKSGVWLCFLTKKEKEKEKETEMAGVVVVG